MPKNRNAKQPESESSQEETVNIVTPNVLFDHDEKSYYIDVELPGVDKQHIDLSVGPQSLCVEASRDDVNYLGCFTLAHAVDETRAKAKYDNGLLRIEIPLKAPLKGKIIRIE